MRCSLPCNVRFAKVAELLPGKVGANPTQRSLVT